MTEETPDLPTLGEALYDLFTIGWLIHADQHPTRKVHSAYTVLGALSQVSCYREYLNRKLTTIGEFRNKVQLNSLIHHASVRAVASEAVMAGLAAGTSHHFVLLARDRPGGSKGLLEYSRILGSGDSYPLYLTPHGQAYARSVMANYPELTPERYDAGHGRFQLLRRHERNI